VVLLEGLRRELACHIERLLAGLVFAPSSGGGRGGSGGVMCRQDFMGPVLALARKVEAFRSGFEHVQDYLGVSALQLWHQEMGRVMGFLLHAEEHMLLRKRLPPLAVMPHHDRNAPIAFPDSGATGGNGSFISRTANALQMLTDTKSTLGGLCGEWQVASSGEAQLDGQALEVAYRALGQPGFATVCKYLGFLVCGWMRKLFRFIAAKLSSELRGMLVKLVTEGNGAGGSADDARMLRSAAQRLFSTSGPVMDILAEIGRLQLLRRRLHGMLQLHAQLHVPVALEALRALDGAGLMEARELAENDDEALPSVRNYAGVDGPSLEDMMLRFHQRLASASEGVGLGNPLRQFYKTIPEGTSVEGLDALLACGIIVAAKSEGKSSASSGKVSSSGTSRFGWHFRRSDRSGTAAAAEGDHAEGGSSAIASRGEQLAALAAGLATLLQHLPKAQTEGLLTVLGIYLGGLCQEKAFGKEQLWSDGAHLIDLLECLLELLGLPREHFAGFVPQGLLDLWHVH